MDLKKFSAAANLISLSVNWDNVINGSINDCALWLENTVTDFCDLSTPRQKFSSRTQAYWWSDKISKLRSACNKKRRKYTRAKRKAYVSLGSLNERERNDLPARILARKELCIAKNALVTEIRRSKTLA